MDLQEAFDAGFVAVKAYVDDALAAQQKAIPDLVRAAVAQAVAAIEPPQNGKDADQVTPEQIAEAVRAHMEANPPRDGEPGEGVDLEAIEQMVARSVAALPPAEPGKDADPEEIKALVAEAIAALPPAEPGKDAEPIAPEQIDAAVQRHLEANPIKTVTVEDLAPVVESQVAKAVEAIPPAKDGADAAQIASFVKDHTGSLIVTLSDGRVIDTGIRDGERGEKGRDALTLTDFDTQLSENGRVLTLSLENDETSVRHELQLPVMIYRGGYKEGVEYVEGDTVTFGGSLWCAASATTDKPTEGRECWRLAARRGRDGKDAKVPA
jgi:hypothetical protein